eukprot:COSAG02_NODE_7869_length_2811_cov_2.274705_1_plen_188_part_00
MRAESAQGCSSGMAAAAAAQHSTAAEIEAFLGSLARVAYVQHELFRVYSIGLGLAIDIQVALDPFGRGDDLFVNVLGFAKTQAPLHAASNQYYALVNREDLAGDTAPPGYATLVLEWRVYGQSDFPAAYATDADGNQQYLRIFIPAGNHRYSAKTLKDILNAALRGQHAEQALTHTNVAWTQSLPVV